jgi:putative flippase GtrA
VFQPERHRPGVTGLAGATDSDRRAQVLKLVRFGAVGLSSSLLYGLLVSALLRVHDGLIAVHCVAYALAIPYSYFAQRGFTFRSSRSHKVSFPRFLLTNIFSFLLSTGIVAMAAALRLPAAIAVAAVIIIVPLINYLCLNAWVFPDRTSAPS